MEKTKGEIYIICERVELLLCDVNRKAKKGVCMHV